MMPGRALHRLALRLLPADICQRVIEPHIADFQHEWSVTPSGLSRMLVLLRWYGAFWWTFACCAGQAAIQQMCGMTGKLILIATLQLVGRSPIDAVPIWVHTGRVDFVAGFRNLWTDPGFAMQP